VCPKKCIALELNSSGFFEAHINLDDCIHCDACRKVCPQNSEPANNSEKLETPQYYVAESRDNMVLSFAASGGVAYELSRSAILKGWKVIGTSYNLDTDRAEWRIASTIEGLWRFCGSKYIQSCPLDVVSQINPADKYMIIATPCQISGLLKLIERKRWNRDNFVLVDFHCHGVPSYTIWNNYISMVKKKMNVEKFTNIQFRNKVKGWHTFVMRFDSESKVYYSTGDRNLFYDFFFSHIWFNHCCIECTLKQDKSYGDLRIGDCWNPAFRQYKPGKSSISVFTPRGFDMLNSCEYLISEQHNHDFVLSGQIAKGVSQGKYAQVIKTKLSQGRSLRFLRFKYIFLPSLAPRIKDKLQTLFRRVIH